MNESPMGKIAKEESGQFPAMLFRLDRYEEERVLGTKMFGACTVASRVAVGARLV